MVNNNQTAPVTDEELDQMIWKLERDGMTPKMLSLMRELREVRREKGEPVAWIVHARTGDQLTTDSGYVANAEGILGLHSTPLYTAPPAPPAYKKTENFTDYHAGWNACRAAMLQAGNSRETPDEAYFWDWLRDKMPTTYRWSRELEDTPENSALITKGKASALDMLSAWKGCSAAMQLSGNSEQLEPVSNRDELPATQFKPVSDLYGITSPTGSETSFTFDAIEAVNFIEGGWSVQEYVELERYQEAMIGNSSATPDGWQLVPIVPTEDMVINGFESEPDPHFSDEKEWGEYNALSGCRQAARRAELCWAAMIEAAPKEVG